MEQSRTRVSGKNAIAKIVLAALLSLVGLSVVGVGQAYAASSTTVTSVTPDTGTANGGGTAIVIKGTNFGLTGDTSQSGVTAVTFGGVPATSYTFVHGTQVDAVVPPAMSPTAVVDVQVTANAETSPITAADEYTYTWTAAPTVTAVGQTAVTATSETSNVVTVTAAGTWTTGQEVTLGGFVNGLTPAVYTILAGGSGSFTISFAGAIVTSDPGTGVVSPTAAGAIGPTTGTTPVVIAGTNLAGASAVDFGSTAATSFTIVSATEITAVAPAGSVGPVDITVTTPDATSATSSADTYSYITTPTVTGVTTVASPAGGPAGGGTQVTVTGTSFSNVSAVDFGSTPASFQVNSLDSITATSPAGSGTVDITVVTGLGTSATGSADKFAYNSTLTVANGSASYSNSPGTAVPVSGTSQSGSTVTITTMGGTWTAGQRIGLSGFTNGLTAGTYTAATGGTGTFTITFAPALSGTGTGTATVLNTGTLSAITATSQTGSTVTLSSVGTWTTGQEVFLTGFTNGLAGNYTLTGGGNGSFTVTGSTTGTGTGNAIVYQSESFNAATLVTGGGTINPSSVMVTTQPSSGTVSVVGTQLVYTPVQPDPTSYTVGTTTTWLTPVTTTGNQTVTFQICQSAPTVVCTTGTVTYLPAESGFYVGDQLTASGLPVAVVEDTGSGVVAPSTAGTGTTFTTVTAPPTASIPATNSGFTVTGVGGYRSITPVPTGVTLVPGSLSVTGGDTNSTGKYTATLCTAAMGYVAGTCTANMSGTNYLTPYPYIETSLNVADQVAGGSQLTLPTISATWMVTGASGTTINSYETEFVVVTNVVTIGVLDLDAYPSNLASYLDQGAFAPVPTYSAPSPRWSVNVTTSGPTITSVVPDAGPLAGTNSVVINGTDLSGATSVTIGGASAAITANTATSITVTAPSGTAGAADVVATVTGGTVTDTGGYTYEATPTVSSVTPNAGPLGGTNSVVIGGTNLANATSVTIGGASAAITADTATSITVTAPSGTAGAANVVVTTAGGSVTDTGGYTYVAAPTVSSVTPNAGPLTSGTSVVIGGTNLANATSVTIGGASAAITADTATSLTVTAPSGTAGPANVVVTTAGGSVTDTGGYTYEAAPTVSTVTPNSGPLGGTNSVVIGGTNLANATSVTIGGASAAITADTATSITVTAPSGTAGAANVVVTTAGGSVTDTGGYTYVAAPTISSVTPGEGPLTGNTSIIIDGTNLGTTTSVTIGGANAMSYTVVSGSEITATTPSGTAGAANVVVTTTGGSVTDTGGFTYQSAPTVTSVVPNTGSVTGGDSVVVNGTNLLGATVTIGGAAATVTADTSTAVTVTTPAGTAGPVAVVVTTSSGSTTDSGGFTYVSGPAITSIVPDAGPLAGTNSVVINGTDLSGATSVTVGGASATITANTATSITVTVPSGTAGPATVVATVTGGTATSTGGYTYQGNPTVTSVTPNAGPLAGTNSVVIAGTNLLATTSVTIGGAAATVTADTATSVTVTVPSGTAGPADVVVTTTSNSVTDTGGYTYVAAPTVSSVTPNAGPLTSGTSVVIGGTNLANATSVTIGGAAATITADTATSLTVTAPSGTAGAANVVVTTAGGSVTDAGGYTYVAVPTVSTVTPDAGPLAGTNSVVIGGTNLGFLTSVTIGGAAATVTNDTSTAITVTAPSGTAGAANVVVTTAGGSVTDTGGYTYVAAPTISSVTPGEGPLTGNTSITIDGTNLTGATAVTIGGANAMSYTVVNGTEITATTPSGTAGPANVIVTTAGGSVTDTGGFTYVPAPTISTVTPNAGPLGGTNSVVIAGTNLANATSVTIGGAAATIGANTATSLTVTAPSGTAGPANVVVTTAGGTVTDTHGYTYVAAPTISTVTPPAGPLAGTNTVVIAGVNLANATSVTIGGAAATIGADTATSLTVTAPSGTAGSADVVVTTAGGSVTDTSGYFYEAAPTVTSVAPDTGSGLGGDPVTITGTNLLYATSVTFGGVAGTITDGDATSIEVTTPPGNAGAVDVVVTAAGGTVTDPGSFTYVAVAPAPPTISHVTTGTSSATVTWTPGLDGGSPITEYTATATPVSDPHITSGPLSCTAMAPATSCTITGLVTGTTYDFTVVATNAVGPGSPSSPSTVTVGGTGAIAGYWQATASGAVLTSGSAVSYGSAAALALSAPIVGLVPTTDRHGYWLVGADGGVFSYGDAGFYGSAGNIHLNAPIVGMAATSDGKGYWLVAADGGVFAYGDARFAGSAGNIHLNAPVVGIAGNGTTGYWLVASDGGVFTYGSATFHGSAGDVQLNAPVVGIAALANGSGYYLAAADGGVFSYGSIPFYGADLNISGTVVGITNGADGGYTLGTSTGAAYAFGTGYYGNQLGTTTSAPFIGIAS